MEQRAREEVKAKKGRGRKPSAEPDLEVLTERCGCPTCLQLLAWNRVLRRNLVEGGGLSA